MPDLTSAAVRGLYPVTAHETFLNHAAVGPISTRVIPGRDNAAAVKHLLAAKVRVSLRHGRIRVSPHYYNDATDIAALVEGLMTFLKLPT